MTETSEQTQPQLIGHALDAAVAALEGVDGTNPPAYSTDPSLGHTIIEREKIDLEYDSIIGDWRAVHPKHYSGPPWLSAHGPTALIAAMRCYAKLSAP